MNKKHKIVIFAIMGAMLLGVSGCEEKKVVTNDMQALREKLEQKEKDKQNSSSNNSSQGAANNSTTKPTQTVKPSVNQSTGTKIPLDTTKNYTGLELDRDDGLTNTSTAKRIRSNTANMVSRMTGTEPQLKVAVDTFNGWKNEHNEFVAYKVIEYTELSSKELNTLNNSRQKLGKAAASELYRITMDIFQYKQSSHGSPYENTDDSPYYFTVTIMNVNGKYEMNAYASSLY